MSPEAASPALDPRTRLPARERLKINEIFYSIQGESSRAGRPCVLIRLTGCQMRCSWCDSEYSFYEGEWRTLEEVIESGMAHTYSPWLAGIGTSKSLLKVAPLSTLKRRKTS